MKPCQLVPHQQELVVREEEGTEGGGIRTKQPGNCCTMFGAVVAGCTPKMVEIGQICAVSLWWAALLRVCGCESFVIGAIGF